MYNNIVIYIVGPPPEESPTSSEMHIFQVRFASLFHTSHIYSSVCVAHHLTT